MLLDDNSHELFLTPTGTGLVSTPLLMRPAKDGTMEYTCTICYGKNRATVLSCVASHSLSS